MAGVEVWLQGMRRGWVAALLVALTLVATIPSFFALPPVDRDEARFAQSSRQMAESGDWVDIRFQDGTRYKKPVGIYWLQTIAVRAAGGDDQAIWKYRLPSLAAALGAVLVTAAVARAFGASGLVAGLMMAGCVMLGIEARLAKTDAVLLLTILVAQWVLAQAWRGARVAPWAVALFWAAMAASVLVKGPIGVMVTGLTALALVAVTRRAGWLLALRPLWGFALFAALVVPWFVAITVKSGTAFWDEALGRDLFGKVAEAQESHGAPPGSYLGALWLTFFPGSVALAVSLPAIWRARALPAVTFALCWAVPGWLVFEATPTKLVHYTLPFYPAFALMVAVVWPGVVAGGMALWQRVVAGVVLALPVAALLALGAASLWLGGAPWVALVGASAVLVLAGLGAHRALRRGHGHLALAAGALAGAGFLGGGFGVLVATPAIWPAPVVQAALAGDAACPAPVLYSTRYAEPSLVFLAPGRVIWATLPEAMDALKTVPCARALVGAGEGDAGREMGRIEGMNLGTGKPLDLRLLRP